MSSGKRRAEAEPEGSPAQKRGKTGAASGRKKITLDFAKWSKPALMTFLVFLKHSAGMIGEVEAVKLARVQAETARAQAEAEKLRLLVELEQCRSRSNSGPETPNSFEVNSAWTLPPAVLDHDIAGFDYSGDNDLLGFGGPSTTFNAMDTLFDMPDIGEPGPSTHPSGLYAPDARN